MNNVPMIGRAMFKELLYKNGESRPLIADEFIKMGKERGYDVCVHCSGMEDGKDYVCGYWVQIPSRDVQIFLQDVFVDDDSYLEEAVEWFSGMLDKLDTL
jgi:hypothetical protein